MPFNWNRMLVDFVVETLAKSDGIFGLASKLGLMPVGTVVKYQNTPAPEDVAALWKSRAGDAKVEAYDCGGGASYYIAKMFRERYVKRILLACGEV